MKSKKLLKVIRVALIGATVITTVPVSAFAAWRENNTGWWYDFGNAYATGWNQINGTWYYFDQNGYMKTGWIQDNGVWYFLENSGAMKTGWLKDGSTWYYLEPNGAMKTGWLNDNGVWYFLENSGAMKTGWLKDGSAWYYLENSGAMVTGWRDVDGDTYFFKGAGDAASGETNIDNTNYYFYLDSCKLMKNATIGNITTDKDGKIIKGQSSSNSDLTGWQTIDGKKYYVDSETGKKRTGWLKLNNIMGIEKYYLDNDGVLQTGWLEVDGNKYYANEDGLIFVGIHTIDTELYAFDDEGKLITKEGLIGKGRALGYVNADGTAVIGWKTVDGKKYYFGEDGYAVTGVYKVGNKSTPYYFDCNTCELVCNAKYYGIETDKNGQVKKLNDDLAKKDILKNCADSLDQFKQAYGEPNIKYKGLYSLDRGFRGRGIVDIYDEDNKKDNSINSEQVLCFELEGKENGKNVPKIDYFVSVNDGKMYVSDIVNNEGSNLFEMKDNEVVKYYEVTCTEY